MDDIDQLCRHGLETERNLRRISNSDQVAWLLAKVLWRPNSQKIIEALKARALDINESQVRREKAHKAIVILNLAVKN